MRLLTLLTLLSLATLPAFAGEEAPGRCPEGFVCENECPLAKQANERRATGTEALAVRSQAQAAFRAAVLKNLGRI